MYMTAKPLERDSFLFLGGFLLAGMLVLIGMSAWLGDVNQDEGWYLYAGRLVAEGQVPFRDFASTQGPVMSYAYALAYPLVQGRGLLAGRLFTALLGLVTVAVTMRLAARLAGASQTLAFRAAILAAGFTGLNLYHVYFTTIVKTYALTGLLVMLGLWALDGGWQELGAVPAGSGKQTRAWRAGLLGVLGGGLLALAAGTRLSAGILLPVWWLTLLLASWKFGCLRSSGPLLAGFLAGGALGLGGVLGPFLLWAPEQLRFGLFAYHAGRSHAGAFSTLAYKAGFFLRWLQAYFPLFVAGGVGWLLSQRADTTGGLSKRRPSSVIGWLVGTGLASVTLVHVMAAFPYDDYQVFVMPLAAVWVGARLAGALYHLPARAHQLTFATILFLFAGSLSSPLLQDWLLAERDRIWWPLRTESPVRQLQQAARMLRETSPPGDRTLLLTQDIYLAVEADLRVPAGWELGPFSYFPDLSDSAASRYRVMNRGGLLRTLQESDAAWAAFSGYGLAIAAPTITPVPPEDVALFMSALKTRFQPLAELDGFGQAATTLKLYERRGRDAN